MFRKVLSAVRVFKGYWTELLHDIDGYPSSKRLGFLVSIAVVIGAFIANVFWRIVVDAHIIDAALGLGGVSGAGVAAERFGKILPPDDPPGHIPEKPDGA